MPPPDMNAAAAELLLQQLRDSTVTDRELIDCVQWAVREHGDAQWLRDRWPTEALPVINGYFCTARLGQGASGAAFKAIDVSNGRPRFVALKLLQFVSAAEEERFQQREIEILKQIDCPHVARYLDSGRAGGMTWLAMELVEGLSLDEYLEHHTRTLEQRLAIFRRVCEIVAAVHDRGVIHRDLKPSHVLVDTDGQPWLIDFGISAARSEDWPTRVREKRTTLGSILGTDKYMSPEQAWGGLYPVSRKSDIWSLGIMLFEIATGGDYPYDLDATDDASAHDALLQRIRTEIPKRPRIDDARLGEPLETLISRCLAYHPEHRLQSAADLATDIGRCLERKSIFTRRLPLWYQLQRIAVGLAAHWRFGLWTTTVGGVLVVLFAISLLFGVRYEVSGQDYEKETRGRLAGDLSGIDDAFVIAGISEDTITAVPRLAASNGFVDVTADIRTWRGLHGRIMQRLAGAAPAAVVWDYYFPTPQPGDAAFVEGARRLSAAGVPVVVAVDRYHEDGRPNLSDTILTGAGPALRCGLILARDMVSREGEFVMALRRRDHIFPSLILSAFAAVVHPDCRVAADWRPGKKSSFSLVYHPLDPDRDAPRPDPLELTTLYYNSADSPGTPGAREGDALACKAFPLERPDFWQERTVPYEWLLTASPDELHRRCAGRIVVLGDLRHPRWLFQADRHDVRYGDQIIKGVPGCYLLADGVRGLFGNVSYRSEAPLTPSAYIGVALLALAGCVLPSRYAGRFQSPRAQRALLALLPAAALACIMLLVEARNGILVHGLMFAAALCLAATASFAIEFARNRYRVPAGT